MGNTLTSTAERPPAEPDGSVARDTRLPPQRTSPFNSFPVPQALIDLNIHAQDGSLPTLTDIARGTGYTLPHMSKVFGKKRAPSYQCAAAIAKFLGVRVEQLYDALGIKVEPYHTKSSLKSSNPSQT